LDGLSAGNSLPDLVVALIILVSFVIGIQIVIEMQGLVSLFAKLHLAKRIAGMDYLCLVHEIDIPQELFQIIVLQSIARSE
jgi:hypothetical protein